MTITGGTALSKDDIDKMVKEAEAHAEEDRQRFEEAETRNTADSLVFQTEKLLKEQADNVSDDERQKIEEKLKALKDALAGADIDAVKRGHEELLAASQEFAQRLYQQAAESQQSAGGPAGGGPDASSAQSDDDVVDAEIVDDEDHKGDKGEQKGA